MANFKPFRFISLACLFILKSAHVPTSASTLEGFSGTLFSPSAQSLGHLGLAVSVSASGHQDESMIRDNRFYFHQTGKAGDPDTAQVQDIQSGAVRLNLGFGVGPYADFGLSVPYFADLIGDTKAKDLSGSGIGDAILSVKLGQSLAGPSVLTGAILGNLSIPSKSKRGFLPKQPDYLITDTAAGLPRFFSSHEISGTAQSILTLDLTGLETRPPFRSSLNAGFAHSGLKGSAPQVLLGGGMEWIPLPTLEFFANIQSQTRLSRMGEFAKIGNEFSYAAVGFCATGDDGIYFSVSVQKSLANR